MCVAAILASLTLAVLCGLALTALDLTEADSYLNLTASATTADISRAYRRRSLELQCVCLCAAPV